MQVNIEEKSSVKKVIHIEIPQKDVAKELDKAYRELKKTAEIKGFRKGKIPRKVLESRFGKDVHADVAPRLIQEAFSKVLEENDLNIVGGPQADPPDLDPKADYVFDITVDIRPELDDVEFKGLELKKVTHEVSEDEVDAQLYMIRKTLAKKEPVKEERPAKAGDFVLIDYEGYVDGEPYDKTPMVENYVMAIGSNVLPKEFSEKLTGVIPEKALDIEVVYDESEANKDLAGKTITYKVTLKEIQEEMEQSVAYYHMQSMNQSLIALLANGTITYEQAMEASKDPEDLSLKLRKIFPEIENKFREGDMSPSPADFSQITELLEIKRLYEEAEERFKLKMTEKEEQIQTLEREIADLRRMIEEREQGEGSLKAQMEQLQAENERLKAEANKKINTLNERIRDLNQKLMEATGGKPQTGFFKR